MNYNWTFGFTVKPKNTHSIDVTIGNKDNLIQLSVSNYEIKVIGSVYDEKKFPITKTSLPKSITIRIEKEKNYLYLTLNGIIPRTKIANYQNGHKSLNIWGERMSNVIIHAFYF